MVRILKLLGVSYLHLVLSQMQHALTEGNQLFVLSYSLCDMIAAVKDSVKNDVSQVVTMEVRVRERNDEQTTNTISEEGLDVTRYPLLRSLSLIHQITLYDLFEDGARTREVEELRAAAKANYHELAVNRSYETWQRVTSMLPTRRVRDGSGDLRIVHYWLSPIFQRVARCEDMTELNRLREVMKACVQGLMENPSVQPTTLIAYCVSMMQDAEKEIERQKEDEKSMKNSIAIWTTSAITKRVTSDGRDQLLVQPERKLTGNNLNEDKRKRVNKTSREELVGFALQVGVV